MPMLHGSNLFAANYFLNSFMKNVMLCFSLNEEKILITSGSLFNVSKFSNDKRRGVKYMIVTALFQDFSHLFSPPQGLHMNLTKLWIHRFFRQKF